MEKSPIVNTKNGSLQGKVDVASNGRKYFTFHGIPYAEPPVGFLRFKAPKPVKHWSGILDAAKEGDACYCKQHLKSPSGGEDCLTLNVFTRTICRNNVKNPVMVWIHGGGFVTGSSEVKNYGPQFFMCEDIVLVTINYRLGIFGFLSLRDKSLGVPGNAGLKDQIMALRWVQDHIGHFGGDANNVTVFGESAGASSIHFMLCSPMAVGLFHKVILQSGSAFGFWTRGQFVTDEISEYFNVRGATEKELLSVLTQASKEEILQAANCCKEDICASFARFFCPVIEGFNPYEESFLLDEPMQVMRSGNYIKVPVIIGYNSLEGVFIDLGHPVKALIDFYDAIPNTYGLRRGSRMAKAIGDKIQNFYFGNDDPQKSDNRKFYRLLATDTFFLRGIYQLWQLMHTTNPHPVYVYRFAMEGKLNLCKQFSKVTDEGVSHGDEIFYMFNTASTPTVEADSIEHKTIKRFVGFWTNFAKTSDPNKSNHQTQFEEIWHPSDGNCLLHFGASLDMISFPEYRRMVLWDEIDSITNCNKL